jgi:hypothetical protein
VNVWKFITLAILIVGSLSSKAQAQHVPAIDVWASAGIGAGVLEYEAQGTFGLHLALTAGYRRLLVSARHTSQVALLRDDMTDVSFLVGTPWGLNRFTLVPMVGAGLAWGSVGACLLCDSDDWGPDPSAAFELQVIPKDLPWIGLTLYGTRNSTNSYAAAAISVRFGRFPGDT